MGLKTKYKEKLKDSALFKYILGGSIPGPSSLKSKTKQLEDNFPSLGSRSVLSQRLQLANPMGTLDLEDFQLSIMGSKLDLSVLREELLEIEQDLFFIIKDWNNFYKGAESSLIDLNEKLSLKLFLNQDSEGYLYSVNDSFKSLERVNTNLSDVKILTSEGVVSISDDRQKTYSEVADISNATILASSSVRGGVSSITTIAGTSLQDILMPSDKAWIGLVRSQAPTDVSVTLTLQLANPEVISRILFKRLRAESAQGSMECYYTQDGVNWARYGEARSLNESLVFIKEATEVSSLKFKISKSTYDQHQVEEDYIYYFDCAGIDLSFNTIDFRKGSGSTLISNKFKVPSFNKAAIEACEITTESTQIKYFLSSDQLNWIEVNPTNKAPNGKPYVVSFTNNTKASNLDKAPITEEGDPTLSIRVSEYDKTPTVEGAALVNFEISKEELELVDVNSFEVLQGYCTEISLNKIEGWEDTGSGLKTNFLLEDATEVLLDFGPYSVNIDGVQGAGIRTVKGQGWHQIEVPRSSYSFSEQNASNVNEILNRDLLYPYNTKHIIEGYQYSPDFTGEKLYQGFKARAEKRLIHLNLITELQSGDGYYTMYNSEGALVFQRRRLEDIEDFANKRFYISYNVSNENFKQIYFKATLETSERDISPLLLNYTIKMGF